MGFKINTATEDQEASTGFDSGSAAEDLTDTRPTGGPLDTVQMIQGGAGNALTGMTANWGDELVGAGTAAFLQAKDLLSPGTVPEGESITDTYKKIRDNLRNTNKQYAQENPVAAGVQQVAGGMIPLGKGMSALQGAGVKSIPALSGIGGAWGLVDYLGEIEKFDDFSILEAAKRSGLGALIPAALSGGAGIKHWLFNREKDQVASVLGELRDMAGGTPDIRAEAKALGPQASLADSSGEVGIGLAQGVRGEGALDVANTMKKNLGKIYNAKGRIRETLQASTGRKGDQYYDTLEELKTTRKANAEQNYGAALDEGTVVPTKRMLNIMNTNPSVKEAWETVQNNYARNDIELPDLFRQDADGRIIGTMVDGKLTGEGKFPNMRAIQELKWEMDRQLSTLRGSVDAAGKKEYQRLLRDKNQFLDDVYKQNPDFQKANNVYAGDIALESAQALGKKHGLGRGNVEDQLKTIEDFTDSEKSAYLQGLMSDVYSALGRNGEDAMGALNFIASENSQKVLAKLVGKGKAAKILNEFKAQKRYREVENKVLQGSQTDIRRVMTENLRKRNKKLNVEDMKRLSVTSKAANWLLDALPNRFGKMDTEQMVDLAGLLTKEGGTEEAIARMSKAGLSEYEIGQVVTGVSALGTAGATYSSGDQ